MRPEKGNSDNTVYVMTCNIIINFTVINFTNSHASNSTSTLLLLKRHPTLFQLKRHPSPLTRVFIGVVPLARFLTLLHRGEVVLAGDSPFEYEPLAQVGLGDVFIPGVGGPSTSPGGANIAVGGGWRQIWNDKIDFNDDEATDVIMFALQVGSGRSMHEYAGLKLNFITTKLF